MILYYIILYHVMSCHIYIFPLNFMQKNITQWVAPGAESGILSQVTNPPEASDFVDDAARLEFAQKRKEQAC